MEKELKKQIVRSAMAVKRKVKMIKDLKNENNLALETIFKPITDPLQQLAIKNHEENSEPMLKKTKCTESNTPYSSSEDFEEPFTGKEDENESDSEFIKKCDKTLTRSPCEDLNLSEGSFKSVGSPSSSNDQSLSWSLSSEVLKDVPFGIKSEKGKILLGKTRVFVAKHVYKVGNQCFKKTPGLHELLFKKTPQMDLITDEDLQNYKLMLMATNAHRRNCDPTKPINSNKGFKYTRIIKPLFKFSKNATTSSESLSKGEGLDILKKVNKNTDLVYWNDPNELVERLKLLLASKQAGNTGVDNEIVAIIEELYEAGIINIKYNKNALKKLFITVKAHNASTPQ